MSEEGTSIVFWHLELYSKCLTYLLFRTFGKPIILSGQTIGPFNNWFDKCFARFALNRVNIVTLREKISKNVLNHIGVTRPRIIITADDATLLPPAIQKKVREVFSSEKISVHRPLIGVNIYGPAFRNIPYTKLKKVKWLLAKISDYLVVKHNAKIVFVSTCYGALADDRAGASEVLKLMKHKDKAFIIAHEYDDRTIKGIVGQMDLAIGLRYHFIVFAVNSQVPSIGIYMDNYYSMKINGILDLVGLEKYACNIEKICLKDLINLTEDVFLNKKSIRKILRERTRKLEKLSLISIKYVTKFLGT